MILRAIIGMSNGGSQTMIETRLLQYFLTVAQELTITKAAQALYITQPTLSKQMIELEQQLGKQLFIRGKRKLTLTEAGEYLRDRAREILELLDNTEAAFQMCIRDRHHRYHPMRR